MQMQLWQDGFVAALAAVGVCSLLWCFTQVVFVIKYPIKKSALVVIPVRGDGGDLQEQVYALTGFGRDQGVIGRILVVDCGLDETGKKLCRILTRENRWVTLCRPDEVAAYLQNDT